MSVADRDPPSRMTQRVSDPQTVEYVSAAENVPQHARSQVESSVPARDHLADHTPILLPSPAVASSPVVAPGVPSGTQLFTVDVEEYFQVVALSPYVPRNSWGSLESRVEPSIDRLLELMASRGATGTFFVVGWVAERHPGMVKRIAAAGHELASHTYDHKRITHQTRDAFRDSIRRTKQVLEDLTGTPVLGFRAPSFSIVRGTEWALDLLIEEGHRYDSSLFPVSRAGYGYSGGGRDPYFIDRPAGRIAEIPPATLQVLGKTIPAAGGAYFRILPPQLVHAALRSATARGVPGTFYIHPWEWDPGQPLLDVPMVTRVRHYFGQRNVFARVERLLESFKFASIASVLSDHALGTSDARRYGTRGVMPARATDHQQSFSSAV
jgi:polysaccharide deacetylase family protein (PEP-CTERM system associated)